MKRLAVSTLFALGLGLAVSLWASPPESNWQSVDEVFGFAGKDLPGGVHRFGWGRSDLHVTIGNVTVEPAIALGSWAGFLQAGGSTVTMGDLVLLDSELDPVIGELQSGGFDILAIHNHLVNESPHVIYLHFHGHGDAAALAKTLKAALAKTKTPAPGKSAAAPTAEQTQTFEKLQAALGRKGTMAGTVLQVGVPRSEAIHDGGIEVPASLGMSTSLNFQTVGAEVATSGDFVLIAEEVNPVIRELRAHGIAPTALHSHMLTETPRLFFMHFWGGGSPEKIGEGLKAALAKTASK
ncbi:MAG TPA: DUF1259 domain-containing protein [Thermoanaerobaculia bacterium]|nr:DUF1259 domain-containing protein [Thermoanaerobaculia bacterium]